MIKLKKSLCVVLIFCFVLASVTISIASILDSYIFRPLPADADIIDKIDYIESMLCSIRDYSYEMHLTGNRQEMEDALLSVSSDCDYLHHLAFEISIELMKKQ